LNLVKWIQDFFNTVRHLTSEWVSFYQIILRKQIDDDILIFCEVVNEFQTTATDQAKNSKLSLWLAKNTFDFSFVSKDAESAHKNVCEKNREKAKKERNKKKSKTDKESAEDADFPAEQEYIIKRIISSFKNHLDDFRSRNQIFKK